jgi:hypothetical protein
LIFLLNQRYFEGLSQFISRGQSSSLKYVRRTRNIRLLYVSSTRNVLSCYLPLSVRTTRVMYAYGLVMTGAFPDTEISEKTQGRSSKYRWFSRAIEEICRVLQSFIPSLRPNRHCLHCSYRRLDSFSSLGTTSYGEEILSRLIVYPPVPPTKLIISSQFSGIFWNTQLHNGRKVELVGNRLTLFYKTPTPKETPVKHTPQRSHHIGSLMKGT